MNVKYKYIFFQLYTRLTTSSRLTSGVNRAEFINRKVIQGWKSKNPNNFPY